MESGLRDRERRNEYSLSDPTASILEPLEINRFVSSSSEVFGRLGERNGDAV
jgi:hypothetical protein